MNSTTPTVTNNKTCPICGSDMKRDKADSPHNVYTGHYTCCNDKCGINATVRN